jgi:hypothetical protein
MGGAESMAEPMWTAAVLLDSAQCKLKEARGTDGVRSPPTALAD